MCTGNCTEGSNRTVVFDEVEDYGEVDGACVSMHRAPREVNPYLSATYDETAPSLDEF
jgi:hypothetical protein